MTNKAVDVDLRIRARNLAGKTLEELNQTVEAIAENQRKQSSAADLAARSMRSLTAEARALGAMNRELSRREGMVRAFVEQQQEIRKASEALREMTQRYREMERGVGTSTSIKELRALGIQIVEANESLNKMVRDNQRTGTSLQRIGVDADKAERELKQLTAAVQRSAQVHTAAEAAVNGHAAAQRVSAEAAAEAARREAEVAQQVQRNRKEFQQRSSRAGELQALRQDIEARSQQARAMEVAAEARRRLSEEAAREAAAQEEATRKIREAVQAYDAQRKRRADAVAAFGQEAAAADRAAGVRNRLVALLNTERGQRILAAEAKRRETQAVQQNTTAHTGNAAAIDRSKNSLALFNDVGRKSLGTYQRIRGQILALAAGYIGVYRAINTARQAIAAVNRDQSLQIGLRTINQGDMRAAADDYAYLRKEADRLGLVFDEIAPLFANIAIASQTMGMTKNQTRAFFSDTAQAAAGLNLNMQETESLFRAMVQVFSKGKLQAEELRLQIGDRLPGAVVRFAAASNMGLDELEQRLQDGTLSVGVLIKGIQDYAGMYESEMENISNRLQGVMNKATNAYNDFLRVLLNDSNQNKIKAALERIQEFLQGYEGQRFASQLAEVFGRIVDLAILAVDNIDKIVLAVKILIGLSLAKFFNDVVISVAGMVANLRSAVTWLRTTRAAAMGAAGGVRSLTVASRALLLLTGPLGLALIGLGTALARIESGFDDADDAARRFIFRMGELSRARGQDAKAAAEQAEIEREAKQKELAALEKQLEEAERRIDIGGIGDAIGSAADRIAGTARSAIVLRERVAQVRAEMNLAATTAERMRRVFAQFEAQPEEPEFNPPALGGDDGDSAARKAMREANARANARRALQKELLDLDQKLFDTRMDGEVRTSEQVRRNYELTIRTIESETEEAMLKLDQLAQNTRTAHGGQIPEEEAELLRLAEQRVHALMLARNARAMEVSEIQDIRIAEREVNDLIAARDAIVQRVNTLMEAGVMSSVEGHRQINEALDSYNIKIREGIDGLLETLQQIDPSSDLYHKLGVPQLIAGLQQARAETERLTDAQRALIGAARMFAEGMSGALVDVGRGIAAAIDGTQSWGDAIKGARDAMLTFAADFLQQIAQMILQAIILQAIMNALGVGGGGGYTEAIMRQFGSAHQGGIAGSPGLTKRHVSPSVFIGAERFHNGGLPGLRSNEVATILEKGEEVITADDPRHVANGGATGGAVNIDMVNVIDPVEVVSLGLRAGRKTVVNDLTSAFRANRNEFRTALGIQ